MKDAVPITLFILTILIFLSAGRYASFGIPQLLVRIGVAIPLVVSGIVLHFFRMTTTAEIIPPAFPARTFVTLLTGVLEIAGAMGLFVPRFRRPAALWTAILMVTVFPANVYVAGKVVQGIRMPGLYVRTAMQMAYIVLILLAGYGMPGREPAGGKDSVRIANK
jgi:uncharacterized membrane protein